MVLALENQSSQTALDSQFDGLPHEGIIYTPPYSDHVDISLLLDENWDQLYCSKTLVLDGKCSTTKKTQPHKAQMSLSSFFFEQNENQLSPPSLYHKRKKELYTAFSKNNI